MILEAFSKILRQVEISPTGNIRSESILMDWLSDILSKPPTHNIERVIHAEIEALELTEWVNGEPTGKRIASFRGKSVTGIRLLYSLLEYCQSYDHWQFTRWLHHIKASDFSTSQQGG